jgi:hypothetical protein
MMVSLPEALLKTVFQNIPQKLCHIALYVRNVSKSLSLQAFFNFGNSQNHRGLSRLNKVDGPTYNGFLGQELAGS